MCELCGQTHADMVTRDGLTVCASARWCLLAVLRQASDTEIAYLRSVAIQRALRGSQSVHDMRVA